MNDSSCIFEIIYNTMQQSHNTMSKKHFVLWPESPEAVIMHG